MISLFYKYFSENTLWIKTIKKAGVRCTPVNYLQFLFSCLLFFFKSRTARKTALTGILKVLVIDAVQSLLDLLDGAVNVADAVLLQKYLFGKAKLTSAQAKNAELCKDGIVDGFDLAALKRMLLSS